MNKARILVVEDHEINQELIVGMLNCIDYDPEIVPTGKDALEKFIENSYDLILLDLQLPGMDGYEVANRIREIEDGKKRTPIVAVTASARIEEKDKCLKVGMDDFLSKPYELKDIEAITKKYIDN